MGSILVAQCEFEYCIYKYKTPIASTNQTFRLLVQINNDINILINHTKQLFYLISPANIIGKINVLKLLFWWKPTFYSFQTQLLKFNQFERIIVMTKKKNPCLTPFKDDRKIYNFSEKLIIKECMTRNWKRYNTRIENNFSIFVKFQDRFYVDVL